MPTVSREIVLNHGLQLSKLAVTSVAAGIISPHPGRMCKLCRNEDRIYYAKQEVDKPHSIQKQVC